MNLIYHTCYWLQPFPRRQLPDGCDVHVILCITFRFVCYVISQILCCLRCRLVVILLIQTLSNFDLRNYFMNFYYHH